MASEDEAQSLRAWRELRGLSQRDLAEQVGVTQPAIVQMERGIVTPNVMLARRIADALGVADRAIIWRDVARNPYTKKDATSDDTPSDGEA